MLLIDKPKGMTSFDVIQILRKKLGIRKIGHAGTLDPLASGLLLVAVGDETKIIQQYVGLPKTYKVEMLIGERRNTGDMEGKVLEEKHVDVLEENQVKEIMKSMVGILSLRVPIYSAVKQNGEPLYKKARRGEEVEAPIKDMEIHSFVFKGMTCEDGRCTIRAEMNVSSGSYVRSIVEEYGERLGYPATTKELRRTKVGEFNVENAEKIKTKNAVRIT